ncbi:MAG TPA: Gfo/Idh/MocA family oxidoreductase [Candidatus Binatia bacterium]|nr:Gfo/Idh/MocA family oxidoreductase [Candidatus Binatia bacterium]
MSNHQVSGARLRVGIVGCGIIANAHLPYIRKAGGDPVAVADLSIRQSSDLADRFGIQRVYRGVDEMLSVERLDVVHVLTPPHTHARVAVAALERGVHTLVEKPLCLDPAEVETMTAAAERGGAMLTADHNRLFDPPMLAARKLWESGELGDLVAIESFQAGRASDRDWLGELAGGGIGDLIPHPLYLQLYFLGEVEELHATSFSLAESSAPQELRVLMKGRGRTGMLTISTNAAPGLNTLKLCGTKMTVEVNLNNMTIVRRRDYDVPKIIAKPLPNLDEAWQLTRQTVTNTLDFVRGRIRYYPGMGELISRFYHSIREGTPPPVTMAEAAAVVDVTARIWQSLDPTSKPARPRARTTAPAAEAVAV